jgi:hemoglobin/transferrin/lactoferrin receptor protein
MPAPNTRMQLGLSSGFRAPNIDDLSRIFESSTSARQLVVPNPDIKPEYTYNVDLGFSQTVRNVSFEFTGFYTWFRNAIALAPFQLNGADSFNYNGTMSRVYANQNVNKATLWGLQSSVEWKISKHFNALGNISYTSGKLLFDSKKTTVFKQRTDGSYIDSQAVVSSKPLDHIPPLFGKLALQYQSKKFFAETYALFNGWKRITSMNPDGEDNAQYAAPSGYTPGQTVPDGFPSWYTINFKSGYNFNEHFQLQFGIENLLDRNYRYFASGFSAAGRNFIVALRGSF